MTKRQLFESLLFGSERLDLRIAYGNHSNFKITVHPNLDVLVSVPIGVASKEVHSRIKGKAAWIYRQLRYFEQYLPRESEKRYLSGETFRYLGRQYRLKVLSAQRDEVKLIGRFIHVWVRDPDSTKSVKHLLDRWYSKRAKIIYANRLRGFVGNNDRFGVSQPVVRVRQMKGRWGSCSGSNLILLNTELLKAPPYCIDYVIAHELCHLKYRDHGPKFQRMLSRMMPDWRRRKERLERVAVGA